MSYGNHKEQASYFFTVNQMAQNLLMTLAGQDPEVLPGKKYNALQKK